MKTQDRTTFVFSSVVYLVFLGLLFYILKTLRGLPQSIGFIDIFILLFATMRLTELFVYDKIMQFPRDLTNKRTGLLKTVHELLSCPWCTSIWAATLVVFIYYLLPLSWIVILIFAISGVASMIQVWINSKK